MAIRSAPVGTSPFTVRDLDEMPDDGCRYELSNGALIVSPRPTMRHQQLVTRILLAVADHVLPTQEVLTETELFLRDDTAKVPDLQVVDKAQIVGQRMMGTPALVVEIASPSTAILDRTEKRVVYAEAGIPAFWLVDPAAETITVLELQDGAYFELAVLDADGTCEVHAPTTFVLDASTVFG